MQYTLTFLENFIQLLLIPIPNLFCAVTEKNLNCEKFIREIQNSYFLKIFLNDKWIIINDNRFCFWKRITHIKLYNSK